MNDKEEYGDLTPMQQAMIESVMTTSANTQVDDDEHFTINKDRTISIPQNLKVLGVQYEHNVEIVTFDCPRYWDGTDLSTMNLYINYIRSDGQKGKYLCESVAIDENDTEIIHFNWKITRNVTLVKGKVRFLVCAKKSIQKA